MGSSRGRVKLKTKKNCIFCFSGKHTELRRKSKDWIARKHLMRPSGATCLAAESGCWSSTQQTSSCHWKLTCSHHGIAENCWIGVNQQSLTYSCLSRWRNNDNACLDFQSCRDLYDYITWLKKTNLLKVLLTRTASDKVYQFLAYGRWFFHD